MLSGIMKNRVYRTHIANFLSLLRMLLTPPSLWLLVQGYPFLWAAACVCAVAAITDFYDGYFARRYHMTSKSGSFLDPLADKVLVLGHFFTFVFLRLVPLWIVIMIAFRDVVITFIRMVVNAKHVQLKTSYSAKLKTTLQFASLCSTYVVLIWYWRKGHYPPYDNHHFMLIKWFAVDMLMYLNLIITYYSGFLYVHEIVKMYSTTHLKRGVK